MKIPHHVYEDEGLLEYLQSRKLLKSYIKAVEYFKSGRSGSLDLKLRKPHSQQVRSFRITQKYRAFGFRRGDDFIVVEINDHQ